MTTTRTYNMLIVWSGCRRNWLAKLIMGSCQQQLPLSDVVATSGKRTDRATSGARCRKPQQQSPLLSPLCNISICCFRSIFQKRKTRCLFMEHRKRSQAKWIPPGKANQFSPFSCFTTNPAWISDKLQSLIGLTKKMHLPLSVSGSVGFRFWR